MASSTTSQTADRAGRSQKVPFDADLTGYQLGAFVTGALHLGAVIEGNVYHPGSIVDNLTSFGAVPSNFDSDGNVQVSVSRWVAQGVAGIHGTTAEPISNAFPHRRFLVDYVKGFTLALRTQPAHIFGESHPGDPILAPMP